MRTFTSTMIAAAFFLTCGAATGQSRYVGTKMCGMCHRTEMQGRQFDAWKGSEHAKAFTVLATPKALEVAKAKGISNPAEAKECLECHTTVADAKSLERTFDMKEGVQCETCHGAGSAYKAIAIMKDHTKSVAAGMIDYSVKGSAEKKCRTCHNEKSPTFKGFEFEKMWAKIQHPVPKAG